LGKKSLVAALKELDDKTNSLAVNCQSLSNSDFDFDLGFSSDEGLTFVTAVSEYVPPHPSVVYGKKQFPKRRVILIAFGEIIAVYYCSNQTKSINRFFGQYSILKQVVRRAPLYFEVCKNPLLQ
jgi:hypothetical protein